MHLTDQAGDQVAGQACREFPCQQGGCGLDFDGGPGNCGAIPPRTDNARFMLGTLPVLQDRGGQR